MRSLSPFWRPFLASTNSPSELRRRSEAGFTLIELLVVLVILGLLVGLVGPQVIGYLSSAKSDTAKVQVEQLNSALELFLLDVGRYPSEAEGLDALVERPQGIERWNGPYLRKGDVPLDPWGNPYRYTIDDGSVRIYSFGADNAEGGDGENRDVGS